MSKPGKAEPKAKPEEWNDTGAVDEFLNKMDHPLKPAIEAIRST